MCDNLFTLFMDTFTKVVTEKSTNAYFLMWKYIGNQTIQIEDRRHHYRKWNQSGEKMIEIVTLIFICWPGSGSKYGGNTEWRNCRAFFRWWRHIRHFLLRWHWGPWATGVLHPKEWWRYLGNCSFWVTSWHFLVKHFSVKKHQVSILALDVSFRRWCPQQDFHWGQVAVPGGCVDTVESELRSR